jgi:hypothetical protein
MAVRPENWDGIGSDRTDLGKPRVGNESAENANGAPEARHVAEICRAMRVKCERLA